jgi:predicted HTH domain antitoxin
MQRRLIIVPTYGNIIMEWIIQGLRRLSEIKPDALQEVLRDIKDRRPEIFRSLVIIAYIDEKISLSKASELLGLTRIELQTEFKNQGIPIRTLSKDDIIAEVEMLRACC